MRRPDTKDITSDGMVEGGFEGIETWYLHAKTMGMRNGEYGKDFCIITEGHGVYYEIRVPLEMIKEFIKKNG